MIKEPPVFCSVKEPWKQTVPETWSDHQKSLAIMLEETGKLAKFPSPCCSSLLLQLNRRLGQWGTEVLHSTAFNIATKENRTAIRSIVTNRFDWVQGDMQSFSSFKYLCYRSAFGQSYSKARVLPHLSSMEVLGKWFIIFNVYNVQETLAHMLFQSVHHHFRRPRGSPINLASSCFCEIQLNLWCDRKHCQLYNQLFQQQS